MTRAVRPYILNWIKKQGGGTVNLQEKSVTITENGTSIVEPDSGYNGMTKVNILANIVTFPPKWSDIGITETPYNIIDDYNYSKSIYDEWDNSITNMNTYLQNNIVLKYMPLVDISNVTQMNRCFQGCKNLMSIPLLNTSNVVQMNNIFNGCENLKTIPLLDTSKIDSTTNMFYNCKKLESIPLIDISNATSVNSMFQRMYRIN